MTTDFRHGKNTEVWLDGLDLSGFLNDAALSADADAADTTTFGSDWKSALVGASGAKYSFKGLYDPALVPSMTAILGGADSVLTVAPAGAAAVGDLARLISVQSTQYSEASPVGGVVAFSWATMANGTLGWAVVLHPLSAEIADSSGTSATFTGPVGGTAAGAIAHLHVTALSSGDALDVVIEDSANGTDWAEISAGATFATVEDAPGTERLLITGAVRRYLRVAWDTSGNADPATFSVALARL